MQKTTILLILVCTQAFSQIENIGEKITIKKLKPCRYEHILLNEKTEGLVAQDVETVIPSAVHERDGYDNEGNPERYKTISIFKNFFLQEFCQFAVDKVPFIRIDPEITEGDAPWAYLEAAGCSKQRYVTVPAVTNPEMTIGLPLLRVGCRA